MELYSRIMEVMGTGFQAIEEQASRFSDSEKQRIKGCDFNIKMYINSSTGRVDEVSFEFHRSGPFATIPVSVYRKIETEIKKELWFTLTAEGKMLSYIFYWWAQEPQ